MTAAIDRTFAVLDLLAEHPAGISVQAAAQTLQLSPSACHRILNDLVRLGLATQPRPQGDYRLTMRLAAMGLAWLGRTGIADVAQPVLDRLAQDSAELVRLSVVDGDRLIWVAVAQGATSGLRYDPAREQGAAASLAYSASGRAWAATLPEDRAAALVAVQGLAPPPGAADGQRLDLAGVLALLARTRAAGHAEACDCFLAGMAAIAVALPDESGRAIGCLSIAGPAVRLTPERRAALLPVLLAAATEIAATKPASGFFRGRA